MAKKKFKEKLIGKTKILIGKHIVKCTISRNKKGNLVILHEGQEFFNNGTCSELMNNELTIMPYE
jgi:hypothetical protein